MQWMLNLEKSLPVVRNFVPQMQIEEIIEEEDENSEEKEKEEEKENNYEEEVLPLNADPDIEIQLNQKWKIQGQNPYGVVFSP